MKILKFVKVLSSAMMFFLMSCGEESSSEPSVENNLSSSSALPELSSSSAELVESISGRELLESVKQAFVIKPVGDMVNVTDEERIFLDSLAAAYPQNYTISSIDGMVQFINYDACYNFSTTEVRTYVSAGLDVDASCSISLYEEENGLVRRLSTYGGWRTLESTILVVSSETQSAIVYLAYGEVGSAVESVKTLFRSECDSAIGSFYDYVESGKVAVGCAVKNVLNESIQTLVDAQSILCKNQFGAAI